MRIGVAGMGFGAQVHIPALTRLEGFKISALSDSGTGSAVRVASQLVPDARVFHDGVAMARWDGIDAVSVAVPPAQQGKIVRAALEAGKHVICEKPFGANRQEAQELFALAQRKGLCGVVCYEFRYDAMMRNLFQAVADGRIGKVQRIAVTWLTSGGLRSVRPQTWRDASETGGGVLVDWSSHVIDYVSHLMKSPIIDVWAETSVRFPSRSDEQNLERIVTAPDTSDMICHFDNGVIGQFTVSNVCAAGIGHRIEVYGDKGRIVSHHAPPFSSSSKSLTLHPLCGDRISLPVVGDEEVEAEDARVVAFERLIKDFQNTASGGFSQSAFPGFEDGAKVWNVLDAAALSSREGRVVRLKPE